MAQTGQIIDGKFRIEKLIGRGGMSRVYLARDTRMDKTWVVKEIRQSMSGQENTILTEAALTEADIIRSLDHPAVVRIVDIIRDKSAVYIVEDYVDGISLKDYAGRDGAVDEQLLKDWAIQLCEVLIYLHSRRPPVIFRDLKPENVILTRSGHLKLVDFGIARRYRPDKTRDTVYLGTERFAAPEQYEENGQQTDMRTDIYGLGKTLEYLAGCSDGISRPFEEIIRRCVCHNPEDRYQDAESLQKDLEHYEDREKHRRARRRRRRILTAAALLCTGIGVCMLLLNRNSSMAWERIGAMTEKIRTEEVFTKEEEEELLNLLLPDLDQWKEQEGFEKTAYEIGELYWNYYAYGQDRTVGMAAAAPWFAMAQGYDPSAAVYEMTGRLRESIRQTDPVSCEKGTYAAYYERLRTLLSHAEKEGVSEMARSEACLVTADMISSGSGQFEADEIEKSQMEDLLRRAEQLNNAMQDSPGTEQQRLRIAGSLSQAQKAVARSYGE